MHLVIEGERFVALEASEAGLTLPNAAAGVEALVRGGTAAAVLELGAGWPRRRFDVRVRLAGVREGVAEVAFVALPPKARERLRTAPAAAPAEEGETDGSLALPPGRRLLLSLSAPVWALTRARRRAFSSRLPPRDEAAAPAGCHSVAWQRTTAAAQWLIVYGAAVLAVLALLGAAWVLK